MIFKRIFFFVVALLMLATVAQAKVRKVTQFDANGNVQRIIELNDTLKNGKTVSDTLSIMTYDTAATSASDALPWKHQQTSGWETVSQWPAGVAVSVVAIVSLICIFVVPMLVIALIIYLNYKNRKSRYRLAQQALANGQPLPLDYFKKANVQNMRTKGIRNIFLGLGLFIFLWALTDEFGIGSVGLLILCIGLGQLVIYQVQDNRPERRGEDEPAR
ncbi:MAG: DUF6249 domain-containing protein [Prevotellaceae bacterium]|jgi:hypothetical protein|nr:DUF6249 domain-containing protein [Prevotellaceae bacterium]